MRLYVPALVTALALCACTAVPASVPMPPPLPAETIPLPPVSEQSLIWRPGDWMYVDGSYRYESGRYVARGNHGASWVFGHWTGAKGEYLWVPGDWI